jgi:hypothetical protein
VSTQEDFLGSLIERLEKAGIPYKEIGVKDDLVRLVDEAKGQMEAGREKGPSGN